MTGGPWGLLRPRRPAGRHAGRPGDAAADVPREVFPGVLVPGRRTGPGTGPVRHRGGDAGAARVPAPRVASDGPPPPPARSRADVVAELEELSADRDRLHAALGTTTVAEVVALVRRAGATPAGAGGTDLSADEAAARLAAAYAEREALFAATGCTSPAEVGALVVELRAHAQDLLTRSRQRVAGRAQRLQDIEKLLS